MTQSNWLEELLASVPPILEESLEDDPDSRHFVFERDDLGEILGGIEWLASEDDPWQGQCAEALAWLNETAGLDSAIYNPGGRMFLKSSSQSMYRINTA